MHVGTTMWHLKPACILVRILTSTKIRQGGTSFRSVRSERRAHSLPASVEQKRSSCSIDGAAALALPELPQHQSRPCTSKTLDTIHSETWVESVGSGMLEGLTTKGSPTETRTAVCVIDSANRTTDGGSVAEKRHI